MNIGQTGLIGLRLSQSNISFPSARIKRYERGEVDSNTSKRLMVLCDHIALWIFIALNLSQAQQVHFLYPINILSHNSVI